MASAGADGTIIPESGGGPIHCIAFNSDASCFAVGTPTGFSLYATDPSLQLLCERDVFGGVSMIAMFGQSNVFGLVRAASRAEVLLWDDMARPQDAALCATTSHVDLTKDELGPVPREEEHRGGEPDSLKEAENDVGCVVARLKLASAVMALRIHPRCLVVADRLKVHIYDSSLDLVMSLPAHNLVPTATCAVMSALETSRYGTVAIAVNGDAAGSVRLIDYAVHDGSSLGIHQSFVTISPHQKPVAMMALSLDGEILATSSISGTAIKLIDFRKPTTVRQLNRGATPSTLLSLSFIPNASLIVAVSETGTCHIFSLKHVDGIRAENPKSVLNRVAETVRDAGAAGSAVGKAGKFVSDALSYAQGDFAFATFSLGQYAGEDVRRIFGPATLAALRPKMIDSSYVVMLVAQGDFGKLIRVAVEVTKASSSSSPSSNCTLIDTASFPPYEL